jgi:hypothetical protein
VLDEKAVMYDTHPGILVAEWEVHRRHRRNQLGDWRCAVKSILGPGACTNLLKHEYLWPRGTITWHHER